MPTYKLIKDGVVVNTIIADEIDSIRDQYDAIEEVIPEPVIVIPIPMISGSTVRNNLTFAEKVKWDNNKTETIVTAKLELATPKTVEEATPVLDFMVQSGDISRASADKIIAAAV